MNAKELAEMVFRALGLVPVSRLPGLLEVDYTTSMPKRSKTLFRNLTKDVYSTKEPRLLVIIGHLYFDHILTRMVDREPNNLSRRQKQSFYAKLTFLNQQGKFEQDAYECLKEINSLRNCFAHNIFYAIENCLMSLNS